MIRDDEYNERVDKDYALFRDDGLNPPHSYANQCVACGSEMPEGGQVCSRCLAQDPVTHPTHYCQGGIEVLDAIEAWQLPYHLGNVVKYVARAGKKSEDTFLQDLRKARFYLDRFIERASAFDSIRQPQDHDSVNRDPVRSTQDT